MINPSVKITRNPADCGTIQVENTSTGYNEKGIFQQVIDLFDQETNTTRSAAIPFDERVAEFKDVPTTSCLFKITLHLAASGDNPITADSSAQVPCVPGVISLPLTLPIN